MALPQGPVYLCDVDSAENHTRIVGDRYIVHIDGPEGPRTWTIDLCPTEERDDRAHDKRIRSLIALLEGYGEPILGAELVFPEMRKVTPGRIFYPEQNPLAPYLNGSESTKEEPPVEEPPTPSIPGVTFSSEEESKPEVKDEPKWDPFEGTGDRPETFYEFVRWWADFKNVSLPDLADRLGYNSSGTIYRWKSFPPQADRMATILARMGYPTDKVLLLVDMYVTEEGKAKVKVGEEPDPFLDALKGALGKAPEEPVRKPRIPPALKVGDRAGGLNTKAIIGNGRLYGVNPRG